jgi:hypothetical protein
MTSLINVTVESTVTPTVGVSTEISTKNHTIVTSTTYKHMASTTVTATTTVTSCSLASWSASASPSL